MASLQESSSFDSTGSYDWSLAIQLCDISAAQFKAGSCYQPEHVLALYHARNKSSDRKPAHEQPTLHSNASLVPPDHVQKVASTQTEAVYFPPDDYNLIATNPVLAQSIAETHTLSKQQWNLFQQVVRTTHYLAAINSPLVTQETVTSKTGASTTKFTLTYPNGKPCDPIDYLEQFFDTPKQTQPRQSPKQNTKRTNPSTPCPPSSLKCQKQTTIKQYYGQGSPPCFTGIKPTKIPSQSLKFAFHDKPCPPPSVNSSPSVSVMHPNYL